jgi:hypothetical protein
VGDEPARQFLSLSASRHRSVPGRGKLTIAELPAIACYSLANMQVWSEPASAPDHEFVCFEPTVSSEDALNRPADYLNIAPHSSLQVVLQLTAELLKIELMGIDESSVQQTSLNLAGETNIDFSLH